MAMTKIKGLQQWCRRMTDGYAHVDVANFTTAWRDGMAFCAIIHRFRPDLIDYDSLSPDNVFENCKMAFEVAEKELSIPAFLEAEDMARLKVPDKLSVITYVSQYYNFLNSLPQLGGPGVKSKVSTKSSAGAKRPPDINTSQAPSSKKPATGDDGKENVSTGIEKTRQGTVGDKCNICQNRVYLLERHIEGGKLYHRSCYRHSELSPTNKVYTRSPFLSPSLSKETPPLSPSSHVKTSSSNSEHQHRTPGSHHHHNTGGGGANETNKFSITSSDSPRKTDTPGIKHSLAKADREDNKRSKLQTTSESSDSQNHKAAAIRDKLKNLKEKYETAKKADDVPSEGKKSDLKTSAPKEAFPLTGKESRQLEKRREHILSVEKRAEQSSRAATRNMPLIFQQKDNNSSTLSTSASNILSKAKQALATSSSSTPTSKPLSSSSSTISNTPTSSKNLNSDPPPRKTALKVVKAELVSRKEGERNKSEHNEVRADKDKNAPGVKDNEKADITSLQKKFSKTEDVGSSSVTPHPVAKARTHKPSDVSKHDKQEIPTPVLRKTEGNTSATPKAAPRKSLAETKTEKKVPQEEPKQRNLFKEPPPNSDRSSGSGSPPPLPATPPPPLPTSPLSLPPSAVINLDGSSPRDKAKSSSSEVNKTLTSTASYERVSTHGPVKSRVAVSSQAVATTSNKRHSSPAIHDPPLAVFVTPQVKDKEEQQVLSGLLVSLAGVRGRASSIPGLPALSVSSQSEPTPSLVSSAVSHTSPVSQCSPSPSSTPAEQGSSKTTVRETLTGKEKKQVSDSVEPKKSSHDTSQGVGKAQKITNGPRSVSPSKADVPEALNVLNNLKKVGNSKSAQSTDLITKTSLGSGKTEMNAHNTPLKTEKKNALSASKENLNKISSKASSAETTRTKTQERVTDANFNTVKLKNVAQPDPKDTKIVSTLTFDVQLKKVDKTEENKTEPHPTPTASSGPHATKHSSDVPQSSGDGSKPAKHDPAEPAVSPVQARNNKPAHFYEEDDLPDWKAALEERKKKLRVNVTKSDSPSVKEETAVKDKTKSQDIVTPSQKEKISPRSVDDSKTKSPRETPVSSHVLKSPDIKTEIRSGETNTFENSKSVASSQLKDKIKKNDWKHDAEMKIAALGGFESEDEEKEASKTKRLLPKVPDIMSVPKYEPKTNEKNQTKSDTGKEGKENKAKGYIDNQRNEGTSKDSVPEFLTGKAKLKHVELNEDTKQLIKTKKDKPAPARPVEKKTGEDFREKLHNLKHVEGTVQENSTGDNPTVGQLAGSKEEGRKATQHRDQPAQNLRKLTQPLSLGGENAGGSRGSDEKNMNNNRSKEAKDKKDLPKAKKKSLLETVNLTSSPEISDDDDLGKTNQGSPQTHSTPILENGKVSPKTKKKKIPFFGKNKKEKPESPIESPITGKKKIEAPVSIDFDKSSEFESSLPDATARLTIEDPKTPPRRSPSPHLNHQKVMSPKHISAIELQQQLLDIDSRLTDLELRGRDLEDSIRNVNVLEEDDDSLMIKWFELVSEKNDLVRQEADLVYMSREQDLETEQEHIESQLRYLMSKPEEEKSAAEKEEEEYLIQRKLELVEQRNRIVDSMDEDRLRYEEEDRDIEVTLRDKGLWKDSNGTLKAIKGKRVSNSIFYT